MPQRGTDTRRRYCDPCQGLCRDPYACQGTMSLLRGQQPAGPCWEGLGGVPPAAGSPRQGSPHTRMGNPIQENLGETALALERAQHLVNSSHCDCLIGSHKELDSQIPLSTIWHNLCNYWVGVLVQRFEERLRPGEQEGEIVLDECQCCLRCARFSISLP